MFWATLGSLLGALILYGAGRAFGEERTRRVMLAVPLIDSDDVDRADAWFSKHGEKAVLIGRLIPGFAVWSRCRPGPQVCPWAVSCS